MNDDETFAAEAKEIRGGLLLGLEEASSASELAEFQVRLSDEIIRTEERRKKVRQSLELKEHLLRLRLLGDSLAWRLLHPHAIRNLAKNDGRPPILCDRRPEVEKCLATVRWLSSDGIPAVVADLTHCLRIGDVVGDHTLILAGPGERLELTHRAHSRAAFATGALEAARWVAKAPPGIHAMREVLGLQT